jgi:polysaccharide export outer membrane protein
MKGMKLAFTDNFRRAGLALATLLLLSSSAVWAQGSKASSPPAADASYRIRKGDKLSIKFLYQPELNEPSAVVRPDGFIGLQMIEDVKAEGLTSAELKTRIEQAYHETLLNPVVSVSILEFVPHRVFVGGQVSKPGSYELREGQTVFQAVMLAGGFTREAHRKMVLHARPAGPSELKVTPVDLTRVLATGQAARDLRLEDGDYIYVPESKLSKFSRILEVFRFAMPGFVVR